MAPKSNLIINLIKLLLTFLCKHVRINYHKLCLFYIHYSIFHLLMFLVYLKSIFRGENMLIALFFWCSPTFLPFLENRLMTLLSVSGIITLIIVGIIMMVLAAFSNVNIGNFILDAIWWIIRNTFHYILEFINGLLILLRGLGRWIFQQFYTYFKETRKYSVTRSNILAAIVTAIVFVLII